MGRTNIRFVRRDTSPSLIWGNSNEPTWLTTETFLCQVWYDLSSIFEIIDDLFYAFVRCPLRDYRAKRRLQAITDRGEEELRILAQETEDYINGLLPGINYSFKP